MLAMSILYFKTYVNRKSNKGQTHESQGLLGAIRIRQALIGAPPGTKIPEWLLTFLRLLCWLQAESERQGSSDGRTVGFIEKDSDSSCKYPEKST